MKNLKNIIIVIFAVFFTPALVYAVTSVPWAKVGTFEYPLYIADFIGIGTTTPRTSLQIERDTSGGAVTTVTNANTSGFTQLGFTSTGLTNDAYVKKNNSAAATAGDFGANDLLLWNVSNGKVGFGFNNQPAAYLYSTNSVNTILHLKGGADGTGQESTISTNIDDGSGNRYWTDWTTQNYNGKDQMSSINIAKAGTAPLIPFVIRFWDSDRGTNSATSWPILFGDPGGLVALGNFASSTGVKTNAYIPAGSNGAVVQVGASTTVQTEFAVYLSATVTNANAGFVVNQDGTVGIGTSTPGAALEIYKSSSTANPLTASVATSRITNSNTTDNNHSDLSFTTLDNAPSPLVVSSSRIVGIHDSHVSNAVSGDLAFLTRDAGALLERIRLNSVGNLGIGTTSPIARLDIEATSSNTNLPLFDIQSPTTLGIATTSLFKVDAIGSTTIGLFGTCTGTSALTTNSSGTIICGAITGTGGSAFPFTPTTNYGAVANSTSTPIWLTAGIQASSTSNFDLIKVGSSTANTTATSTFFGGLSAASLIVTNNLVSVANQTGTGNVVFSASPTLTGTVAASTVNANTLQASTLLRGGSAVSSVLNIAGSSNAAPTSGGIVFKFGPNGLTESARVDGVTGNWSIGTTSPSARLEIDATSSASSLPLFNVQSPTTAGFATSSVFRVNAIGSTTLYQIPSSLLKTDSGGTVIAAVPNVDYGAFGYEFTNPSQFGTTTAATTTVLWGQQGIFASSTSQIASTTFAINGSIGISSSSPTSPLSIVGASAFALPLLMIATSSGGVVSPAVMVSSVGTLQITAGDPSAGGLFPAASRNRLFITTQSNNTLSNQTPSTMMAILRNDSTTANTTAELGFNVGGGGSTIAATAVVGGYRTGSNGQGGLYFATKPDSAGNGTNPITMGVIDQNGQYGVGTTTPFAMMQVATSSLGGLFRGQLVLSDTNSAANLKHWSFASQGGNLYVGTTTDGYATSTVPALAFSNVGALTIPYLSTFALNDSAVCQRAGGLITVDSGVSSCIVSSQFVKHSIQSTDTTSAMTHIAALNPVSFLYNDTNKKDIGLIAEQVASVTPMYAQYTDKGRQLDGHWFNPGDVIAVNWNAIISDLIKTVQSILTRLTGDEAKMTQMQKQIDTMQKQIDDLKKK